MKHLTLPLTTLRKTTKFMLDHLILVSIGISVIIIVFMGYFLYNNFYRTIIAARQVIVLESEVAQMQIDMDKLNSVYERYQKKLNLPLYQWSDQSFFPAASREKKSSQNTTGVSIPLPK